MNAGTLNHVSEAPPPIEAMISLAESATNSLKTAMDAVEKREIKKGSLSALIADFQGLKNDAQNFADAYRPYLDRYPSSKQAIKLQALVWELDLYTDSYEKTIRSLQKKLRRPSIPVESYARPESVERREILNKVFGEERQTITIDDRPHFDSVEDAITYLKNKGCTGAEIKEWLPKMLKFFIIGDSFLKRQRVKNIFKSYTGGCDYDQAHSKSYWKKNAKRFNRANYEKALDALFVGNDRNNPIKPELINDNQVKEVRRLLEMGMPIDIFQFHSALGHPFSGSPIHLQKASESQIRGEIEVFEKIMRTILKMAGASNADSYRVKEIRTTGGGGMWGADKAFRAKIKRLGLKLVHYKEFDSGKFKKKLPDIIQYWANNEGKHPPLIHAGGLAKKLTPKFFVKLERAVLKKNVGQVRIPEQLRLPGLQGKFVETMRQYFYREQLGKPYHTTVGWKQGKHYDCVTQKLGTLIAAGIPLPPKWTWKRHQTLYKGLEKRETLRSFVIKNDENWKTELAKFEKILDQNGGLAFVALEGSREDVIIKTETLYNGRILINKTKRIERTGIGHGGSYVAGEFIDASGNMQDEWIKKSNGTWRVGKKKVVRGVGKVIKGDLHTKLKARFKPDPNKLWKLTEGSTRITYKRKPLEKITLYYVPVTVDKASPTQLAALRRKYGLPITPQIATAVRKEYDMLRHKHKPSLQDFSVTKAAISWKKHPSYQKFLTLKHNRILDSLQSPVSFEKRMMPIINKYLKMGRRKETQYVMHANGNPDVTGAMRKKNGMLEVDCAYFIRNILVESGALPSRSLNTHYFSRDIFASTNQVDAQSGQPGDLMFWVTKDYKNNEKKNIGNLVSHVAIIIGKNPNGTYKIAEMTGDDRLFDRITDQRPNVRPGRQGKHNIVIGRLPGAFDSGMRTVEYKEQSNTVGSIIAATALKYRGRKYDTDRHGADGYASVEGLRSGRFTVRNNLTGKLETTSHRPIVCTDISRTALESVGITCFQKAAQKKPSWYLRRTENLLSIAKKSRQLSVIPVNQTIRRNANQRWKTPPRCSVGDVLISKTQNSWHTGVVTKVHNGRPTRVMHSSGAEGAKVTPFSGGEYLGRAYSNKGKRFSDYIGGSSAKVIAVIRPSKNFLSMKRTKTQNPLLLRKG